MPEANEQLRSARLCVESPTSPGEPLSRQELAEAVNAHVFRNSAGKHVTCVDANHVGKWERGVARWPAAHYRAALRAIFNVSADIELGFTRPARGNSDDGDSVNRKEFLATALGLGAAALVHGKGAPTPGSSDDLGSGLSGPTAHFRRMEQAVSSHELAPAVDAHLAFARGVVDRHLRTSSGFATLAEIAGLAAWLAADRGDHATARRRYAEAVQHAHRAHHPLLASYMTASLGSFAVESGDPRRGVALLDRATLQLDAAAPDTARSWLASLRAVAHAHVGDRASTYDALRSAEALAERHGGDPTWPWVFAFDAAKAARFRTTALARIGDVRAAMDAHRCADTRHTGPKPRALALLEHAGLLARTGQVDESCRLAVDALHIGRAYRSERIVTGVRAFRAGLPTHVSDATTLDDELTAHDEETW